jgi:hypothetical protein
MFPLARKDLFQQSNPIPIPYGSEEGWTFGQKTSFLKIP